MNCPAGQGRYERIGGAKGIFVMNNSDEKNKYVGNTDVDEILLDEQDEAVLEELRHEKRRRLLIVGGVLGFLLLIFVVYRLGFTDSDGEKESRTLVTTYMQALQEADSAKVESVMDPEAVDSDETAKLVEVFKIYEKNGITYTVEYSMSGGYEASADELESTCETVYNSSAEAAGVSRGYVIPVTGTITIAYDGQISPNEMNMNIICYEKSGSWYLGGTLSDGSDTGEVSESE